MPAKIHQIKSASNNKYNHVLENIQGIMQQSLSDLISIMFNDADDILFKLAENAETNESQNQYFDTMRLLRLERNNISSDFLEEIKKTFNANNDAIAQLEEDELSLIDQEAMEEIVAISTMDSKAMNLFGETVRHIEARLEIILTTSSHSFRKDTLAPKHICEALQTSFQSINIDTNNKLILYKLFDQKVCSQLGDMYHNINQALIDNDILPQFKSDYKKSSPTPKGYNQHLKNDETVESASYADHVENPHALSSIQNAAATNHTHLSDQHQNNIFAAAHDFIHGGLAQTDRSSTSGDTRFYDKRDILNTLSKLQSDYVASPQQSRINIDEFKNTLLTSLGKNNGGVISKQVDKINENTIDLIELLFEEISSNSELSQAITYLILRLQIPIIKVAMLDENFFKSTSHPARKFLDKLCFAGKGINDKTDKIYTELESIVNTLLVEYNFDLVCFQKAIDSLNIIINDMQHELNENEMATQKSILNEHAKKVVLEELQLHTQDRELPKSAHPMVLKLWATLMFNTYLHHGKDSHLWTESVKLLKSLILSVQPLNNQTEYTLLKNSHVDLTATLKTMLLNTRQNTDEINESLEKLKSIYTNILESFVPETVENENNETPIIDNTLSESTETITDYIESLESEPVVDLDDDIDLTQSKIDLLPSDVKPGVWFEIHTSDDSPKRRLKLSLIVIEEAKLVFVDRTGRKVIEKDAEDFTNELANNFSSIIADHSVFNNALSRVITSLAANG